MYKFGLIGYPVQHSLSPWIHEKFLEQAGLSGTYSLIEIKPDNFSEEIAQLKASDMNGFNVTVPYKEKIIPYLDEIDEDAKAMGAVNTVLNKDGKWIGFNTDGKGYVRSLQHAYPQIFSNKARERLLLLGGGGAARGIYYALVTEGFQRVDIANRTIASAASIKSLTEEKKQTDTQILTLSEAEEALDQYSVVIQTTSVGMNPNSEESIISVERLKAETIVSDIVYQPIKTKLLTKSHDRGANIHFGHTM